LGENLAHKTERIDKKISLPDPALIKMLCGEKNAHLDLISKKTGVSINIRGNELYLQGGSWEIELAEKVIVNLYELLKENYPLFHNDVELAVRIFSRNPSANLKKIFLDKPILRKGKRSVS